ncbi:NUDIX hydrolase N-terminal domain-containing protein [Aerococcus kribbianus]|uniref:NUDIX hydrolase n=1 Tax=Aerococcus kribbianus TaxID=2999064 RepID=A0A9X3JGG3_9LACT|nr:MULTISPECIES: NUDIX hydrolase [unclassified Aerococcus]MCZ0718101.1 NUDIX hydrolase [Aerococcus sp. YH-aer221]MCZ0726330.1 NUDIX hydrolase [Aerococcus sp. YH-aer222]
MEEKELWLDWAIELQALAQAGLHYTTNKFDVERFERIRQISVDMLAEKTGMNTDKVTGLFASETGYQTPKLDSRAAIIKDDKILLVQEADGLWALPGGWVDVNQTVKENLIKESKEEAGRDVSVDRVIALEDRNKRNAGIYAFEIVKIFALCHDHGGQFQANSETLAAQFFTQDDLPPLSVHKTTKEQIDMCFSAYADPNWQVILD